MVGTRIQNGNLIDRLGEAVILFFVIPTVVLVCSRRFAASKSRSR